MPKIVSLLVLFVRGNYHGKKEAYQRSSITHPSQEQISFSKYNCFLCGEKITSFKNLQRNYNECSKVGLMYEEEVEPYQLLEDNRGGITEVPVSLCSVPKVRYV